MTKKIKMFREYIRMEDAFKSSGEPFKNAVMDAIDAHATELAALREEVDGLKGTNQSCGHPCETCDLLGN